jgi:hypothetical protein
MVWISYSCMLALSTRPSCCASGSWLPRPSEGQRWPKCGNRPLCQTTVAERLSANTEDWWTFRQSYAEASEKHHGCAYATRLPDDSIRPPLLRCPDLSPASSRAGFGGAGSQLSGVTLSASPRSPSRAAGTERLPLTFHIIRANYQRTR